MASSRPCHPGRVDDGAGAHGLNAGPVPVPGRDRLPRGGRRDDSHPGRGRPGRWRSVPGHQPAPSPVSLDADDLLLQDGRYEGLQHSRCPADPQAGQLPEPDRAAADEPAGTRPGRRTPRAGRAALSSSQAAPSPHADARTRGARIVSGRTGGIGSAPRTCRRGPRQRGPRQRLSWCGPAAACRARPASATCARWRRGHRSGTSDRPVRACAPGASVAG